ncbi:hypothetical protein VZG28_08575 [Synechococcus elongatus IITB4]|uniref:hypothetical protein n=1 Tax=Synechococcus elongatus TaxID=32046 RepID=UPI0030D1ED63
MTIISFLLTVITWHFRSSDSVPLWLMIGIIILLLVFTITFADALREALNRKAILPAVVKALPSENLGYDPESITLILEPSELFSVNSRISVYGSIEDCEVFLGHGYVATINNKKYIQAVICEYTQDVHKELWDKILSNNRDALAKVWVKPSVPFDLPLR